MLFLKYNLLLHEAQKAKDEGLICHISFFFHDEIPSNPNIIDTAEQKGVKLETLLLQYNLLDRVNEDMIAYAASKGLGVVAIPVGRTIGGSHRLIKKLTGKSSIATYELAFKFVLGNLICLALFPV